MATITSSAIVQNLLQADGSRTIHEQHVDSNGRTWDVLYQAPSGFNTATALSSRATAIITQAQGDETNANVEAIVALGSIAVLTFLYTSAALTRAALRLAYASANRTAAIMIGDFLDTLTDAQLQALFGMTQAQVTTLRTNRLDPASTIAASIRSAQGA